MALLGVRHEQGRALPVGFAAGHGRLFPQTGSTAREARPFRSAPAATPTEPRTSVSEAAELLPAAPGLGDAGAQGGRIVALGVHGGLGRHAECHRPALGATSRPSSRPTSSPSQCPAGGATTAHPCPGGRFRTLDLSAAQQRVRRPGLRFRHGGLCPETGWLPGRVFRWLGGELLSGAEVVDLVAHHYSAAPALYIMELRSAVTGPPGVSALHGLHWRRLGSLSRQLAWAADELNAATMTGAGGALAPLLARRDRQPLSAGLNARPPGVLFLL